jgi:hypothetical protein
MAAALLDIYSAFRLYVACLQRSSLFLWENRQSGLDSTWQPRQRAAARISRP